MSELLTELCFEIARLLFPTCFPEGNALLIDFPVVVDLIRGSEQVSDPLSIVMSRCVMCRSLHTGARDECAVIRRHAQ